MIPDYSWAGGYRVVEAIHMTVAGEPYQVRRTWRQRLLSRPWRPWKSTRTVVPQVPDTKVIMSGGTLFMHPELARELRNQLKP